MSRVLGLGWILVFLLGAHAAPQHPVSDATVKAAFLTRFPEFVRWPREVAGQPLVVCLSPSQPFGHAVADGAKGSTIRGRALQVRQLRVTDTVQGCQVLYVASADTDWLRQARRQPILTVGDEFGFCQRGGIINFRVINGRVRFEINLGQAQEAGLRVDAQLLALAVAVHKEAS